MYSVVVWIYCIKEVICNPSNGKEISSDLTRRAKKAFLLYLCTSSQRIKIFCHTLLWIRFWVIFLSTQLRGSMKKWQVSQFWGILLRRSTVRIGSSFSEVVKQYVESKPLNVLRICLRLLTNFFPFCIIYQCFPVVGTIGVSAIKCYREWQERLTPKISFSLPRSVVFLCTQVIQGSMVHFNEV